MAHHTALYFYFCYHDAYHQCRQYLLRQLDRILLMYNTGTYVTADVIQTYVYRIAFQSTGFPDYSYGTAVNVLKSIIAFVLVSIVNKIADKVSDARLF